MSSDVCVIVPVFNEATVVGAVVAGLLEVFPHVVCVDDGSTDGSADVARSAGAIVLHHPINLGQGAALQTGFDYVLRYTSATYCVTFDADGQHRIEDAARMVDKARNTGADVVLASRFLGTTKNMPMLRRLMVRGGVWFTRRTAHIDVSDTHNGLRVLTRPALQRIRLKMPRMAHASELLNAITHNGLSYVEEPVDIIYTEYSLAKGQSMMNSVNIVFDLAAERLRFAR
ncbi:MAG: hypothetical protein JWR35_2671 [Marmoricola sp.]|nr:hypothetical protein [Marmoricola sp.]